MSEGVLQAHICWLEEIPEEILLSGLRWHLQRLTDFHLKTILISHHSLHPNAKGIAHQESLCLFSWWESRKPLKLVEKLACQLSLTSRLGKTEGARYTLPQQRSDGSVTLEQTQDTATSMWIGLKKPLTSLENFFQIHRTIARRWGNQYRFWSQGETISLTPIIRGQIGRFAHNCHVKSWLYSTADKANCRPEDWAVNLTSAWRLSLWQGV